MFYRAVTLAIHFGQIDKYGKSIKDSMLQIEQFQKRDGSEINDMEANLLDTRGEYIFSFSRTRMIIEMQEMMKK